jgi:3-methyladenine DNA glycosylase AlkD
VTVKEVLSRLQSLGDEKLRIQAAKRGAGDNQFGVKMGDLRTLAKEIKTDHALALELWETGNTDAMQLAILLMKPKELSREQLESMVKRATYTWLADWMNSYIVKQHPLKDSLREEWMNSSEPMLARAGWSLTAEKVSKSPQSVEPTALLNRLDKEMGTALEPAQWTMNFALAGLGIEFPEHRDRAIAIGEKHGLYRDYPVSKGCTSPFAPIWIREMSSRKG